MMIFLRGLGIGVAIALSPGPVLALILTQSFQYGARSGVLVAAASSLATLPVVLVALSFQLVFQNSHWAQQCLGIVGMLFLIYLAIDVLRAPAIQMQSTAQPAFSFIKGFLATCLFPVAYLFWISVGIPLSSAGQPGAPPFALALFVAGFMITLFLVNSAIAFALSHYGKRVPLRLIHILCRSTALIFIGFAASLARQLFWAR